MFKQELIPKSFCKEYVELKGNLTQLSMFMAVALGIKPLMDDWIEVNKIEEFKKVCKQYGLKVREDIIFLNPKEENISDKVLDRGRLTTTKAYGFSLKSKNEGQIHLFISKDNKLLKKGMWYPVIIKNRAIFQPRIDSLKYGYVLGYPECCIRFFRKYNNWLKYSYLYEAYINTIGKPSFFCNPFLKDTTFSYIYHMPCSYSCSETIKLAELLRREIRKREPELIEQVDRKLKMPFLVFYERKFYCFNGVLKKDKIYYKDVYFPSPEISKDIYGEDLRESDALNLKGRTIVLYKKNKLFKKIEVSLNNFAPEYPFLIKFLQ